MSFLHCSICDRQPDDGDYTAWRRGKPTKPFGYEEGWPVKEYVICGECLVTKPWTTRAYPFAATKRAFIAGGPPPPRLPENWWHGGE